ncbi:NAD(P)-dependent oxidoreductase [Agarivorans sp. 1_MG-2023]|uniref:NAD-dependent epimerase/dehydratase family protein n=1 Tax=Agarivorans sp. 1_MG-2023 TaxID=3062634 RepID=UPI0026E24F7E|nr:NAD(P)-dependent oxidoreductase [Agarivorans sp. 1_MG-2023]MDO6764798.1 NAD(P)-dependent oxidoreductase [Agarivorans sp. 1_MG-2023]
MKILTTGGTGFLGKALINQFLAAKHSVANIGRRSFGDSRVIDIKANEQYEDFLSDFQPDYIIHLAAAFDNSNIDEIVDVNIKLPLKLLELASNCGSCFVYISTYWQLGCKNKVHAPIDLYSASKKSMASFMELYSGYHNVPCKEVMIYGTYGSTDNRGKLLDILINAAISGESVELSPGEQNLNLVNVSSLSGKMVEQLLIDNGCMHEKLAFISERNYSPIQLVELIRKNSHINVDFGAKEYRKVEVMEPIFDPDFKFFVMNDDIPEYIKQALN